jgi:hypothetical protein
VEWLDKTTRVIYTRDTNAIYILATNWQTRVGKQLKRRNTLRRKSLDVDVQVNISCKPMLKGRVWQSHRHRDETHTKNSCRDPFGSIKEHLP